MSARGPGTLTSGMDLIKVGECYIQRLTAGDIKPRILLLDQETMGIISLCTTQSNLLKHDIYLVDRIDNMARQKMRHLDCVCFVRPTNDVVAQLVTELRNPLYAKYSLIFTNVLKKSQLERLAEADDHEAVIKVQEVFLDYYTINKDLFSFRQNYVYSPEAFDAWDLNELDRSVAGLVAVLLSLKLKPLIRFEANSPAARKLASQMSQAVNQQAQLFDFGNSYDSQPVLLLLDRRNDPVTPLLSHWTYQSMVYEIIGMDNNRVDLDDAQDVPSDLRHVVLAQNQDPFFAEAMYLNFGDLGTKVRDYVAHYQTRMQMNSKMETVADMKRFVEEYPEFRKLSGNVSKHVTLVGELSHQVDALHLLKLSEVEQSLACSENHNTDLARVQQLISDPQISVFNKYKLVALYSLRYETHVQNATSALLGQISAIGQYDPNLDSAVKTLTRAYGGSRHRQEDIFHQGSIFSRAQLGLKGLKGVENVFTQHKPLLHQTLQSILRGKLRKSKYPFYNPGDGSLPNWALSDSDESEAANTIVTFVIGGVTFDEARIVSELKQARVAVGGTNTVNAKQFLKMLSYSQNGS